MEESTYDAIFLGVYVFIFVIAISVTIYLFMGINELSENTYEYANRMTGGSSITNAKVSRYRLMSASEVLSFVTNYRFMDNYADPAKAYEESEFKVEVYLVDSGNGVDPISSPPVIYADASQIGQVTNYKELVENLDNNAQYWIDYESLNETVDEYGIVTDKVSNIKIYRATTEQINSTY